MLGYEMYDFFFRGILQIHSYYSLLKLTLLTFRLVRNGTESDYSVIFPNSSSCVIGVRGSLCYLRNFPDKSNFQFICNYNM